MSHEIRKKLTKRFKSSVEADFDDELRSHEFIKHGSCDTSINWSPNSDSNISTLNIWIDYFLTKVHGHQEYKILFRDFLRSILYYNAIYLRELRDHGDNWSNIQYELAGTDRKFDLTVTQKSGYSVNSSPETLFSIVKQYNMTKFYLYSDLKKKIIIQLSRTNSIFEWNWY
jgi:hypothetical protein